MLRKHVQVKGHVILETMFSSEASTQMVEVNYLLVDALSPYNDISGRPAFNLLWEVLHTLHLSLKYRLLDR